MKDYSQFGEQPIIQSLFKKKGKFLDIGAHDGVWSSNTHALALDGWDGVCVEAHPALFMRLKDTYKDNPNVACLLACMGLEDKIVQLHLADGVTSTSIEHIMQFPEFKNYETIYCPMITLNWIFSNLSSRFDFINIDVEGFSSDLLLPAVELFSPTCVCVEHDHKEKKLTQIMSAINYRLAFCNGVNAIYFK